MLECDATVNPLAVIAAPSGLDGREGRDLRADGSKFMPRQMSGCRRPRVKRETGDGIEHVWNMRNSVVCSRTGRRRCAPSLSVKGPVSQNPLQPPSQQRAAASLVPSVLGAHDAAARGYRL